MPGQVEAARPDGPLLEQRARLDTGTHWSISETLRDGGIGSFSKRVTTLASRHHQVSRELGRVSAPLPWYGCP